MIKSSLLTILLVFAGQSLWAGEPSGGDQDFMGQLDTIKNPFDDGLPKPVIVVPPPVHIQKPKPRVYIKPKPMPVIVPMIFLPRMKLQGVIVGEDIHQAIFDDKVVPLLGTIYGATVDSISKQGVGLTYKGKKFFLKIE